MPLTWHMRSGSSKSTSSFPSFGIVEAQFHIRQVTSEEDRFTLVASVLPESSARKVAHLLSTPPADCYTQLKVALLSSHQLTDIHSQSYCSTWTTWAASTPWSC